MRSLSSFGGTRIRTQTLNMNDLFHRHLGKKVKIMNDPEIETLIVICLSKDRIKQFIHSLFKRFSISIRVYTVLRIDENILFINQNATKRSQLKNNFQETRLRSI